jgi:hypothetical protein
MSVDSHAHALELLAAASELRSAGDQARALELLAAAAELERAAMDAVPPSRSRTRSILAVSAVSLMYRAGQLHEAETLAFSLLASGSLTHAGKSSVLDLVIQIQQRDEATALDSALSAEVFRVEMRGSAVKTGGLAPLDAVLVKLQQFRGLAVRVGEWTLHQPLRRSGAPTRSILEQAIPLLSPARIGSYSFDLRFGVPVQQSLFAEASSAGDHISDTFFRVIEVAASKPEELATLVPDAGYAPLFLKLVRNLAPTGSQFDEIAITPRTSAAATMYLRPDARAQIQRQLQMSEAPPANEDRVTGILRGLDLDRRALKVVAPDRTYQCRVESGVALDDEIGPLVNHAVTAVGRLHGNTFRVRDLYEAEANPTEST